MELRLAMSGFGNVGRGVAQILAERRDELEASYGVRLLLSGVADRRGTVTDPAGLDERALLQAKAAHGSVASVSGGDTSPPPADFLKRAHAEVFIEAASTNFDDAQPGWSYIQAALDRKIDVVLASKGALVLYYRELMERARAAGSTVSYSATLGAPLPVLELTDRALVGATIVGFDGVLNATANVILESMLAGRTYEEGVGAAQALGIAETDPTLDVDGWDAAAKAAILANTVFGTALGIADVAREGIRTVTEEQLARARDAGATLKLVSTAERRDGRVSAAVRVEQRSASDPLGRLRGMEMGVVLHSIPLGDFTATVENSVGLTGGIATAMTVLRDVLNLARARA